MTEPASATRKLLHTGAAAFVIVLACALLLGLAALPQQSYAATMYKIIYKLNGGKQAKHQVRKVKLGKTIKVKKLKAPKRKGYTFKGWYKNKKRTKKAKLIKGSAKKANRTVYAKWARNTYTLAYYPNGGTITGSYKKSYKFKTSVKLPNATRTGYVFLGWYTNKALTKPIGSIMKKTIGNKKLYARWSERLVVAHRGYHVSAAENSLDAYVQAAEMGFSYAETDVRFTKDYIPVLSHNATVDVYVEPDEPDPSEPALDEPAEGSAEPEGETPGTTSMTQDDENAAAEGNDNVDAGENGDSADGETPANEQVDDPSEPAEPVLTTWRISEHTFAELQAATFAQRPSGPNGTNISTYSEFLETCAAVGIYPVVDLKEGTETQIRMLMDMAHAYSFYPKIRWGATSFPILKRVHAYDQKAHIVYHSNSLTAKKVKKAAALSTGSATVYVSTRYDMVTNYFVKLCKSYRLPMGVYGVTDETAVPTYNSYVSTFSIDSLAADFAPQSL